MDGVALVFVFKEEFLEMVYAGNCTDLLLKFPLKWITIQNFFCIVSLGKKRNFQSETRRTVYLLLFVFKVEFLVTDLLLKLLLN